MAKVDQEVFYRVWLDSKRRVKGAPPLFVDVPIKSSGNDAADVKTVINMLRAVLRVGSPLVIQDKPTPVVPVAPARAPLRVASTAHD